MYNKKTADISLATSYPSALSTVDIAWLMLFVMYKFDKRSHQNQSNSFINTKKQIKNCRLKIF